MVFGKRLNKYYLKYAWLFIIGIVTLIVIDYAQLQIPKIYRLLLTGINTGFIDEARTISFDMGVVLSDVCLPMMIIILAMLIGRFLWRVCFFGASVRTEKNLRAEMFDHARKLTQEFYSRNKVGGLMSLFTHDLSTVEECFGWGVMMFFDALFLGVMAIYDMFVVHPYLALLCMIPLVLLLIVGSILNRYLTDKWEIREQAFSDISDFAQESFTGLAVIKAFVKEAKELLAFGKLNLANEEANVSFTRLAVALRVSLTLFVESVIGVIIGAGGYFVYSGSITAEEIVEFIGYFSAVIWPIMAVAEMIDMHSRGKASLKRITEFLEAEVNVTDREGAVDAGALSGGIEFKNLTFSYEEGGREVLKDISFEIKAGENVGIIGKIGSGKTTLMDLITRTYNVKDGTLFLDGKDVNDLTIESVRKNIAYVPQDNFLFSDTIAENIAFATDNYTDEEVRRAAVMACVYGDINDFPDKFYTVLGERGVTVSGGQKQRISIARALMKNAPILMLDDSVSAVDTETEKTILKNLRETRRGKTTVIIAHRISTVENLDRIMFLKEGRIEAYGTHSELIATCPEYARLVELQKLEDKEVA
ncbi:MAG: ABC transporter ATP-binding protein [Clostridia bacterium]|nr:ABC transporter ATP-binding protein [Clostridia bacterium]